MGSRPEPIDFDSVFAGRDLVIGVAPRNSAARLVKRLKATHALCVLDDRRSFFLHPSIGPTNLLRLTCEDTLDPLHPAAPSVGMSSGS